MIDELCSNYVEESVLYMKVFVRHVSIIFTDCAREMDNVKVSSHLRHNVLHSQCDIH